MAWNSASIRVKEILGDESGVRALDAKGAFPRQNRQIL
jgi:hypothetical protein